MSAVQTPLSPQQLEILSIFNNKSFSEAEWEELKELIASFFAKKSILLASEAWEERGMSNEEADKLLQQHLRTPYNPENQAG